MRTLKGFLPHDTLSHNFLINCNTLSHNFYQKRTPCRIIFTAKGHPVERHIPSGQVWEYPPPPGVDMSTQSSPWHYHCCRVVLQVVLHICNLHRFWIFQKVDVKFNEVFFFNHSDYVSTEWLQRHFIYFAIILPLDFSEILNIFRMRVIFFFFESSRKFFKKT